MTMDMMLSKNMVMLHTPGKWYEVSDRCLDKRDKLYSGVSPMFGVSGYEDYF
jgi:hypothetical protein